MSENKHTPEPWYVVDQPWGNGTWINSGSPDPHHEGFVADCEDMNGDVDKDTARINARRIIACVNACEGIPTYQLTGEDGNPVILGDMIDLLRNHRDTLLSICEELRESAEYWSEYDVPLGIVERLTAAIASVEGQR